MGFLGSDSIFNHLNNIRGVSITVSIALGIILIIVFVKYFDIGLLGVLGKFCSTVVKFIGKSINRKEKRYHRDITIGKATEKILRVKIYRFLNDLIIDLGLKRKGVNPYEFVLLVGVGSTLGSLLLCQLIFNSLIMGVIMSPIIFTGVICALYTKANISHDARIEAIIEAENIISNNIKDGVVVAVRNSIDVMPALVRNEFSDFLDNIEHKNYHVKTALLELNNNLGSTSTDFIKKCIVFEMEEEHGIVGMFQDVVEINNIKTEMRTEMKRKFEEVSTEFVIGALMIFLFLGGTIAVFKVVSNFYFKHIIGQIILAIDALLIIGEFVYLTYLRAKEL